MNISYEGIDGVVVFLKLVAATGDEEEAWRCLGHPDLAMLDLEDGAERRYGKELVGMAKKKGEVLTHGELQEVVDVMKRNCKLINQHEGNQKIHSSDMTLKKIKEITKALTNNRRFSSPISQRDSDTS